MKHKKFLTAITAVSLLFSSACGEAENSKTKEPSLETPITETATVNDAEIWSAPGAEKIMATESVESYADVKTDTVKLSAAKNDYESGQIVVSAKEDLHFTVTAGDLVNVNDSTKVISKENFKVYTLKYMSVTRNWYGNGAPLGDYPDAMIPQENAIKFGVNKVEAGKNGGAWISFYIPEDTAAGNYTGELIVKIGKTEKKVPVSLKVYNFAIPKETTSMSSYIINANQVAIRELDSSIEMLDKYHDFLLDYRVSTCCLTTEDGTAKSFAEKAYEYSMKGATTIGIRAAGTGSVNGFTTFSVEFFAEHIVEIAKISLKNNHNVLKKGVVYDASIDEPFYAKYANGRVQAYIDAFDMSVALAVETLEADPAFDTEFGRELIESAKNVKHIITDYNTDELGNAHRVAGLLKNADGSLLSYEGQNVVLCPKVDAYNTAEERATYADHEMRWFYNCNEPRNPYPTYHLDDSLASIMSVHWMMADYDISGWLQWACNTHTLTDGTVIEDAYDIAHRGSGGNGDGWLLYPGLPYGVDGPIPSIRMDAVRDGNEDYEILRMLKAKYEAEGADSEAIFRRMSSLLYEGSSMVGGGVEYEEAREILLGVAEAAFSPAELMITKIEEIETLTSKSYLFSAQAAEGAEVFSDGNKLTATNGVYSVAKSLNDDKNYLSLKAVKDGVEVSFALYLGGKLKAWTAESYGEETFTGDVTAGALMDGWYKLSLKNAEKSNININHESVNEIGALTLKYQIALNNYSDGDVQYKIYVNFSNYGLVEFATGKLAKGENLLEINNFSQVNWASRGEIVGFRVAVFGASEIGVGTIKIYGV